MIKPPTPATTVPLTCRRSEVDHVAGKAVETLLQRLRQRWVGVDVAGELVYPEVPLLGERELGQKFGHVVSDEVSAEQFAVLRVGDDLDEATRFAEAVRLAVRGERELRDLD